MAHRRGRRRSAQVRAGEHAANVAGIAEGEPGWQ